jgi:hypothetical protein
MLKLPGPCNVWSLFNELLSFQKVEDRRPQTHAVEMNNLKCVYAAIYTYLINGHRPSALGLRSSAFDLRTPVLYLGYSRHWVFGLIGLWSLGLNSETPPHVYILHRPSTFAKSKPWRRR